MEQYPEIALDEAFAVPSTFVQDIFVRLQAWDMPIIYAPMRFVGVFEAINEPFQVEAWWRELNTDLGGES